MSTHLRALLMGSLDELRHEPIDKRIRATMGQETVIDTTDALLVWEPKRVVPSYAIPDADIAAEIAAGPTPPRRPCATRTFRSSSGARSSTRASRSRSTPPTASR